MQMGGYINKKDLLNKEQFLFQNRKLSIDAAVFFNETVVEVIENEKKHSRVFSTFQKQSVQFCTNSSLKRKVLQLL